MNKNNMLDPGETILVMAQGYRGKKIKGTRVFLSFEAFADWARTNLVSERCNKPIGTEITRYSHSYGGTPGVRSYQVTHTGYEISSDSVFLANDSKDPKKLKVTCEMLGLPQGKADWVEVGP